MFKFMRSKVEKERATKAEEKKRVELLGWEERRQYYREIPGQTFEISKFNFDGKGNTKVLTFDMEDEPTRDMITTRFLDTYGGGVYIVYCHLPFGRMKFATYTLEGEPILPDAKDKKPKDPIDAAIASAISKIPDSELSKIGPAILQNKLGLPTQSTTPPGYLNDPVMNEKLSIARELRSEKRYAEAAQVLTGSIPKNEGELANALKVMDLLDKRYDTRGGHMSEKAQEYDAIGNLIDKAGNAGEKIIGKIMKGKTRDEEDTGNLGYECQCERCGKVVPEDSRSCPHCGLEFVETTPPSPPRNPVEPPPMIEPPKPPEPLGSIPTPPPQTPPELPASPAAPTAVQTVPEQKLQPQAPVPQPTPEPTAGIIKKKVLRLSKYEKDFIYEALPKIFVNRIKRHYGLPFDFWFKLAGGFVKFSKKEYCAPEAAARYDAEYIKKKHTNEIPKILEYAKIGFEGMIGHYKPMVEAQIYKYDSLSKELSFIKEGAFKAKYPEVTDKDIDILDDYRNLKSVWDFMQQEKAIKWWNLYCPELVKCLEGPQTPPPQQQESPPPPAEPAPKEPEKKEVKDAPPPETGTPTPIKTE